MNINEEAVREFTSILRTGMNSQVELIEWAVRTGFPKKLGISTDDFVQNEFGGYLRMKAVDRRKAVKALAEKELTNSQIGEILGVDEKTVRNDKAALASDSAESEKSEQDASFTHFGRNEDTEKSEESPIDVQIDDYQLEPTSPGWHQLGAHWLYCGDSTDPEFIERCAGAAFAFADPPYNAGKAEWDNDFVWNHDYLAEVAGIVAVTPGIASLADFLAKTAMPYKWAMSAHISNGMTRGAIGFGNWIAVTMFATASLYRNKKDIITIPAGTNDDKGGVHPSRKPLRLITELIGMFTTKDELVIDPFLGSGTTLIAADKLGRRCIGAEIDPDYCAHIIARYEKSK